MNVYEAEERADAAARIAADKRNVRNKVRNCMKRIFSTDEGAVVLAWLAEFAYADSADYCADPRKDAYLQGRRSVVLAIRNIMKEKDDE